MIEITVTKINQASKQVRFSVMLSFWFLSSVFVCLGGGEEKFSLTSIGKSSAKISNPLAVQIGLHV